MEITILQSELLYNFSLHMCILNLSMSGATYSSKSTLDDRYLRNISWQSFCQKKTESIQHSRYKTLTITKIITLAQFTILGNGLASWLLQMFYVFEVGYWRTKSTKPQFIVLISWMATLSSYLIWQIFSFIHPPNEYGCVFAWTTLENGPAIDLQKMPILAKQKLSFQMKLILIIISYWKVWISKSLIEMKYCVMCWFAYLTTRFRWIIRHTFVQTIYEIKAFRNWMGWKGCTRI